MSNFPASNPDQLLCKVRPANPPFTPPPRPRGGADPAQAHQKQALEREKAAWFRQREEALRAEAEEAARLSRLKAAAPRPASGPAEPPTVAEGEAADASFEADEAELKKMGDFLAAVEVSMEEPDLLL